MDINDCDAPGLYKAWLTLSRISRSSVVVTLVTASTTGRDKDPSDSLKPETVCTYSMGWLMNYRNFAGGVMLSVGADRSIDTQLYLAN